MPKVAPFYSAKVNDSHVYHDNSVCTEGNNIEAANKRPGTDGRPLCHACKELTAAGK